MKNSIIKSFGIAFLISVGGIFAMDSDMSHARFAYLLQNISLVTITNNINESVDSSLEEYESLDKLLKACQLGQEHIDAMTNLTIMHIEKMAALHVKNPYEFVYFVTKKNKMSKDEEKLFKKKVSLLESFYADRIHPELLKISLENCIKKFGVENTTGCEEYKEYVNQRSNKVMKLAKTLVSHLTEPEDEKS